MNLNPLIFWLRKLRKFGTIDLDQHDWTVGKEDGYKNCCIKNFINLAKLDLPAGLWMECHFGEDDVFIDYVRCPLCRKSSEILPEVLNVIKNKDYSFDKIMELQREKGDKQ